jgi:hypothetical protein
MESEISLLCWRQPKPSICSRPKNSVRNFLSHFKGPLYNNNNNNGGSSKEKLKFAELFPEAIGYITASQEQVVSTNNWKKYVLKGPAI